MNSGCKIVTVERQLTAIIKAEAPFAKLPEVQRAARTTLQAVLPSLEAGPRGPTCTGWTRPANGKLPMEIGMIVARSFEPKGEVVPSELPAGRAVRFLLKEPFDGLPGAWQTLFEWCKAEEFTPAGTNWEIYGAQQDAELYALLA